MGLALLRRVTGDDWRETPVGWSPEGLLVVYSDRGGGGLYTRDLSAEGSALLARETDEVWAADWVDGAWVYLRGRGMRKSGPSRRSVARLAPGSDAPVELFAVESPTAGAGAVAELDGALATPEALSWSADGGSLYLAGLHEADPAPYQLRQLHLGGGWQTLWSSMTHNPVTIQAAPDGRRLAVGVYAFDDDLWVSATGP